VLWGLSLRGEAGLFPFALGLAQSNQKCAALVEGVERLLANFS
jgi:hypothetical protein